MPQSEPVDARMRACGVAEKSGAVQSLWLPRPRSPGPGEILLDVMAAGVGAWDQLVASGKWDVDLRLPAALGVEGAGRVVAVGPDVTAPAVGDLVLAHSAPLPGHSGLWAEQVLLRAADAAPLPEGLDPARAAALPVNGLTACQALDWLNLSSGMHLLVTNGAGVTGALVLQLAVAGGVQVTATASPRSFDRLRRLGATDVIDYHRPAWPREVGRVFDAALTAAPGTAATAAEIVRPGGRLCSITSDAPAASAELASTDLYVRPDAETLAVLADQLRDGVLDLPTEVLPLDEGPGAFDRSSRGLTGGTKLVLRVTGPASSDTMPA
ncbi:NADP-dependent oxidoreductase [Streptomyces malaysiensis]|uniref:NADP-dependent oxidoreductase n=1 Tax=Streptomyces malaysiensis subsp. samsunensis TaxID=459658 RepID=A0A9X2RYJ3_STRMQ|nr:NADP-dependent oxidoreductase [Streptomyces samsunensis]MCQ8835258.1 NADP-dependent oxidoreductase [Streptomyces samsunensis]